MLTKIDCLDFINLSEKELNIIMDCENLQFMLAIKKCGCLLESPEGILYLHTLFLDNFQTKLNDGREAEAIEDYKTYQDFSVKFPIPTYLSNI